MTTKVQKWGNSLAVRLPKELAERFGLKEGESVRIEENFPKIIIKRAPRKKVNLKEIVLRIKQENRHEKVEWGKFAGKEIW